VELGQIPNTGQLFITYIWRHNIYTGTLYKFHLYHLEAIFLWSLWCVVLRSGRLGVTSFPHFNALKIIDAPFFTYVALPKQLNIAYFFLYLTYLTKIGMVPNEPLTIALQIAVFMTYLSLCHYKYELKKLAW